jgi:hypothetical protein
VCGLVDKKKVHLENCGVSKGVRLGLVGSSCMSVTHPHTRFQRYCVGAENGIPVDTGTEFGEHRDVQSTCVKRRTKKRNDTDNFLVTQKMTHKQI